MDTPAPAQHPNTTQDHGNSSWLLRAYSAVPLLVMARWSWVFPSAAVIPQPILPQYETLPDEMKLGINAFLDPKDIAALIGSTKQHRLFQPDLDGLKLLRFVVRGEQEKADGLLSKHRELLLTPGTITDYSGRIFKNITAYEYAYWAKDTHMCRMLERHMDANTATIMHPRCLDIDKNGLTYEQRGVVIEHSPHVDLTPLKTALENYVNGYDAWHAANNCNAIKAAWMAVGMAQRDVPVHVANEYCRCRRGRSFIYIPAFQVKQNEETLPRTLRVYSYSLDCEASWFSLLLSYSRDEFTTDENEHINRVVHAIYTLRLGVDFAIEWGGSAQRERRFNAAGTWQRREPSYDFEAVSRLDEVRTRDLTESREKLRLISRELGIGRPGM